MSQGIRRFVFLSFLCLAGWWSTAVAGETEPVTVKEVVAAVEQVYQSAEAIKADFVQVTRSPTIGGEQRQKGHVILKRPRKMRWEFTSPEQKVFVSDGEKVWIWSPKDNQVIIYKDFSDAAGDMASLLTDLNNLDELFEIRLLEDETAHRQSHVLELKPKKKGNVKKLQISVSRKKYLVEQVIITDQFDQVTELSFSQVKLNPHVSDMDFGFSIPTGAQIITSEGL